VIIVIEKTRLVEVEEKAVKVKSEPGVGEKRGRINQGSEK
jgi:hypothetical protein